MNNCLKRARPVVPAGTMRFSHYDQVIQAASEGSGIAIGKWPHLARHLHQGVLCAPLGPSSVAHIGGFYLVVARSAVGRESVEAFVAWLRNEVQQDEARAPALLARFKAHRRRARRSSRRDMTKGDNVRLTKRRTIKGPQAHLWRRWAVRAGTAAKFRGRHRASSS